MCLILWGRCGYAQQAVHDKAQFALDLPVWEEKGVAQVLRYSLPQDFTGTLRLQAYQCRTTSDSLCLYDVQFKDVVLKGGADERVFVLQKAIHHVFDKSFTGLLRRYRAMPPGQYSTKLTLWTRDSSVLENRVFLWTIDSTLALQNDLRKQVNGLVAGKGSGHSTRKNPAFGINKRELASSGNSTNGIAARLYRGLGKPKGLSVQRQSVGGIPHAVFYYEDWFLGRYELAESNTLKERAASEKSRLQNNVSSLVSNNLDDFQGVSAQMRELHKARKGQKNGLEGALEMNAYTSTAQEPGSEQEPNYVELLGQVSTEVMGMPVVLEGYYTTQDAARQAKASYFRVRYDVEKAKEELLGLVTDYKRKYSETVAKGKGLEQVYGSYLGSLQGEQASLLSGLTKDYGLNPDVLSRYDGDVERMLRESPESFDTAGLLNRATTAASDAAGTDSTSAEARQKYADKKARTLKNKADIQKRYDQLKGVQEKVGKYSTLLAQYSDGLYLDSAIHGTKLQALAADKDASYKDMAKAASGLLPEGKAKRFASGLTNLEAGILNKYESSYTWAGQTAKGGSIGYDIGFAQVGATVGKTEYVSRSGSVDRYSAYSGRADFEPFEGQKLSLIYYGYSPSRSMLNDERFSRRGVDIALPTFTAPNHIASLISEGTIAQSLSYALEGAASHRKVDASAGRPVIGMANSAIKSALEWAIPKTSASLKGEWEHLGRDFQNSSLPITRAGTERYTVGGTVGLFKDFLHLGVQYHTLRQESFSSTGYSRRWGFDVRTRSKRYPTVALSYKPFATFRAYDDTLAIEQRPLIGEVWTGRASYQIKRVGGIVHRFAVLYNRNSTTSGDTSDYRSATAQLTYLYTIAGNAIGLNGGWMISPQSGGDGGLSPLATQEYRSYFMAASWSRPLGKRASASIGSDAALAPFGVQRLALSLGGAYTLARQPLTLRLQTRWALFQTDAGSDKSTLLAGMLGVGWRFQNQPLARKGDSFSL